MPLPGARDSMSSMSRSARELNLACKSNFCKAEHTHSGAVDMGNEGDHQHHLARFRSLRLRKPNFISARM